MRVLRRQPSSTRARPTRCSASGPTARRSPRATPAPTCASWCCTARSPRRPTRARAPRGGVAAGQPRRAVLDGIDGRLRPLRLAAATAGLRRVGRLRRAGARAPPAPRCARAGRSTSSTPTTPFPAGDAVRRARIGVPLVVSVHGGDVLFTAQRFPGRGRAQSSREAQLVLANSSGIEARARALGATRTQVLHLGTDLPTAMSRDRSARRDRRPPRRAQAPRRRHPSAVGAARPTPGAALPDHRRRARARRAANALAAELERRPVEFCGQLPHDDAMAALRRRRRHGDAEHRRGVRRRLRRGHGRRDPGDRRTRRTRPRRDRRRRPGHPPRATGRRRSARQPSSTLLLGRRRARGRPRRPRDGGALASRGSAADGRPSPPTRQCCR